MHTILSFDYGNKKIGLAVGNDLTQSAQEICTISNQNGIPDWAQLDKIINEWKPDVLLVGLPLNMDGSESTFSAEARAFGESLVNRYNLKVEFEDERLSSNEADRLIRQTLGNTQGLNKKLKARRDQIAARLILESYFNRL